MRSTATTTALFALVAAVAAWTAPGAHAANDCLKTCLAPYETNTTASIKASCRDACKLAAPLRRECLKAENRFWRNQTKICRGSLRNIKQGLGPVTADVTFLTPANATTNIPTTYTYTYDVGCAEEIKKDWKDAKKTCHEILCPADQYWTLEAHGCVDNPYQNRPLVGLGAPVPALLRGFYKFSWKGSDPYQGPSDTNVGVTFTGRLPGDPQANISPMTKDSLNLLSYGGGNEFGAWSLAAVQAVAASGNLDAVIALKYDGIVIDAEVYASGQSVTVSQWNDMFAAIKAKKLLLIVTISHFSPYGMGNGDALVTDWLSNPNIDFLSPQLYTTGTEPKNDWDGFSQAWVTATTPIAPSIVQESYYDQLGSNSVTAYLPKAKGYLVWSNTPAPQPGPGPTCASGYFPVRGGRKRREGGMREREREGGLNTPYFRPESGLTCELGPFFFFCLWDVVGGGCKCDFFNFSFPHFISVGASSIPAVHAHYRSLRKPPETLTLHCVLDPDRPSSHRFLFSSH